MWLCSITVRQVWWQFSASPPAATPTSPKDSDCAAVYCYSLHSPEPFYFGRIYLSPGSRGQVGHVTQAPITSPVCFYLFFFEISLFIFSKLCGLQDRSRPEGRESNPLPAVEVQTLELPEIPNQPILLRDCDVSGVDA